MIDDKHRVSVRSREHRSQHVTGICMLSIPRRVAGVDYGVEYVEI